MSEKKHALISPSGLDRSLTCLGSTALTKDLPNTTSKYSEEGTDYHTLAAVCLEEGTDAIEHVGGQLPSGALVDEDKAKILQSGYIDHVRAYAATGTLLVEEPVPLAWYTANPDDEGTSDAVVLREDPELIVIDLKYGQGVEVLPDDNRQCKTYAIGVIEKHQLWDSVQRVRIVICQPRTGDGKPKEWVCSIDDLRLFKRELIEKVTLINTSLKTNTPLPLTPSEKACKFCKARAYADPVTEEWKICPALQNVVEEAMEVGFEDLTKAPADSDGRTQLGKVMDKTDLIEIFVKAVRAAVEVALLANQPVVGTEGPYKLVQGKKGDRKWTNDDEAETLLKSFRMKLVDMYDMKLISPTSADKLMKKVNPKRWKKVSALITQSDGKLHVAPATDKRPAVSQAPAEEGFESVEEYADLL